jgi:hypothetical protein
MKQKFEPGNFSGRLADNIKQDFHAIRKYGYRANVKHAVGVLKDRLIGILITEDRLVRKYLYRELVSEIRGRVVPVRPNREVPGKEYLKKPHFHHNHKSNC